MKNKIKTAANNKLMAAVRVEFYRTSNNLLWICLQKVYQDTPQTTQSPQQVDWSALTSTDVGAFLGLR